MKRKETARVETQRQLAEGIYDCRLKTSLALDAAAGQFVALYPADKSLLLPRPISICETDRDRQILRLVYRVAGAGTAEFSRLKPGDEVALLGVLGNGFPLKAADVMWEGENAATDDTMSDAGRDVPNPASDAAAGGGTALLLGGGIGIPPMLELAKELPMRKLAVLGYRDGNCFLREDIASYAEVYVATEDGSVGTRGNVLDSVREHALGADVIYACGPMPMLRAIKAYAAEACVPAYLSLEERMACGVGACLGCVCATTQTDAHSHVKNARVCTDGPVFLASRVDLG